MTHYSKLFYQIYHAFIFVMKGTWHLGQLCYSEVILYSHKSQKYIQIQTYNVTVHRNLQYNYGLSLKL